MLTIAYVCVFLFLLFVYCVWILLSFFRVLICLTKHGFSYRWNSVAQSCPTLCDPMKHSTLGLPVPYQLPESTQTHVHRVGDAIQPSHPLLSPSPPALNLFQHHCLFK